MRVQRGRTVALRGPYSLDKLTPEITIDKPILMSLLFVISAVARVNTCG